ncbi:hypothetical protein [Nonlabens agnitus]|uniref:Uncharacterized protein n=1 Tax=Nonlabens agnitus TaxID=870484 RepID=A0A2S9WY54_9FLAO|nr:hypothetical protein [Nonlabens agnitus]PRP68394.1 hypothetical protein BST86_11555 [Nonlabens agnitus]
MKSNRNERVLKIVGFYFFGLVCLVSFYWLDNSDFIAEEVKQSKGGGYNGFRAFLVSGLIKYGFLVAGICSIVIMSLILIQKRISENHLKNKFD